MTTGATGIWFEVKDGDDRARALYLRHYSSAKNRPAGKPRARQFMPPGEKFLLLTVDCLAVFGWVKQQFRRDGEQGVYNCLFRNEAASGCLNSKHGHCSSRMIAEACDLAWAKWPGERLFTMCDPLHSSANPGYCYKRAGFRFVRINGSGQHVLEAVPA